MFTNNIAEVLITYFVLFTSLFRFQISERRQQWTQGPLVGGWLPP